MALSLLKPLKRFARLDGRSEELPKVMVFWSPTSSGKTTLAGALAASLAWSGRQTVALDLDFQTPNLPWSEFGFDDLAEDFLTDDFSRDRLMKRLPKAGLGRLWVLGGAEDVVKTEVFGRREITMIIDELATSFDAVVIDTSRTLQFEPTLAALYRADVIYVPVRMVGRAPRHVVRYLNFLCNDLQISRERLKVVLNDVRPGDLDKRDVERALGFPIATVVPHNRGWLEWDGNSWISSMPSTLFNSFFDSTVSTQSKDSATEEGGGADAASS